MIVIITQHAYDRSKERLKWNTFTLEKMAEKAYKNGLKHSESKGNLKKYLTKLYFDYKSCNNVRIHGQIIYLFNDNKLITLYQIPNNLKKYLNIK